MTRAQAIAFIEMATCCTLAFALAFVARFQWIEPASMEPLCQALAGAGNDWRCAARELTIAVFSHNRLGWAALIVSALALIFRLRALAVVGAVFSVSGLVLYSAAFCAPAFWLSVLARTRAARSHEP
jgi:hypothetical protein